MGQINCSDDMLYEKKISEKDIFDGRVFKVKVRQIETPEGKPSTRELVFHNGGACVLPIDDEQNVYLADGKLRTLEHPKKKRLRHVQLIKKPEDPALTEKILQGEAKDLQIIQEVKNVKS